MILHIPHSSTYIENYELNNRDRELLRMTDHFTDDLYDFEGATKIVLPISRLICDVERFEDDNLEGMSEFGMGICYTKDTEGEKLRDVSVEDREGILNKYYHPHHQRLLNEVDGELKQKGSSLIIDCHSFPDKSYYFNSDFNEKRPDICIGSDEYHTPRVLINEVKKFFLSKGYLVYVNNPYAGTIVPLKHYKKDKRLSSVMIEINRKLYLDEDGYKTEHYDELKSELNELLNILSHYNNY